VQLVSRDEASEVGETADERVHRERGNSCHRDRQQAQDRERELAEQDVRLWRENPLLARNMYPDFSRALNTPSEVGGVLAQIADGLSRTPDAEGYRRLLTQAANHLLPLAHPVNDLRHAINSRRDARSFFNVSRYRRHENGIRCNTPGVPQGPGSIHSPMAYYHMCLSGEKGHQNFRTMA
jgi:hypothetical protein